MRNCDKLHLCDHLVLNEGAYFYKKNELEVGKDRIQEVFNSVLTEIEYELFTKICRKREIVNVPNKQEIYYSLLVFKFATYPSFLDFEEENFPKNLMENRLAYLLIVEINDYIILVKKNISRISSFINSLTSIPTDTLAGVLVDDDTVFQQMKLSNMNMNENAMRNKSYEANSLENTMPMFGSNHTVVNTARFANTNGLCTVNINTSRLAKFGTKKNLIELLEWMNVLITKIDSYIPQESFFSRFAKPQSWKKQQDKLEPVSLLIDIFKLNSYIQELHCTDVFLKKEGEEEYFAKTNIFAKYIISGMKCLTLDEKEKDIYRKKGKRNIGVKKMKSGLKIVACGNLFDSLYYCEDDGTYVKIIDLMNNLGCFSVGFSNYSYIYMGKRLYMNVGIQKDFESILSILYPMNEIAAVTSEKGDGYDATSTDFKIGSMFNVVEKKIFNDADFLLCDDLGNEWSDHIAIRENSMSYIHSKCNDGSVTLSASKFQEVIGQAIKNIGNMNPDDNTIQEKMKGMNGKWNGTNIDKCRIGMPADYERLYKKLRYNPNKVQEICLAVNYLSKSALAEAFDKIKNNQPLKQKNNVVQLVWLLSGFISTCKEADLNCRIFCKD